MVLCKEMETLIKNYKAKDKSKLRELKREKEQGVLQKGRGQFMEKYETGENNTEKELL